MGKLPVKYFVVDAFTESAFKGNPAGVCFLEEERDDKWLQAVAAEFNLPMFSFLTRISDSDSVSSIPRFHLRWFTPVAEVQLCGHATLAASHALFSNGLVDFNITEFDTLSGILTAKKIPEVNNDKSKEGFLIELDFPIVPTVESNSIDVAQIAKALNGASVVDIKRTVPADDLIVVLSSAKAVAELKPQFDEITKLPGRGLIVSGVAPSDSGFDFYTRFFVPKFGATEDPVCGSAHCALGPYWSKKLGKCNLTAYQASARSGILKIHFDEQKQRVLLRGKSVSVMEGSLLV